MSATSARADRAIAGLDPAVGAEAKSALRRLREDCGCREGAIVMVSATAATAVYLAHDAESRSAVSIAAIVVGVLFLSAAVGKAIGLLIARTRLLLLLRRLERSVESRPR